MTSLLIVNIVPDNPYFTEILQTCSLGEFFNFNGAKQLMAVLWPFFYTIVFIPSPVPYETKNHRCMIPVFCFYQTDQP